MKVKITNSTTDVATIKAGECFSWKGLLYMRIFMDSDFSNNIPVVLLTTGHFIRISPDTQVERVDCMVVSTDSSVCDIKFNDVEDRFEI